MTLAPIDKPVGIIGNDEFGAVMARRVARSGRRVIFGSLPGSPSIVTSPRLELASTPTDVAFECQVVVAAIGDTEILRHLLFGDPDRMGLGAEMSPGSVLVDAGARTPRELGAFLGVLGTRGVAVVDAALIGDFDAVGEGRGKIFLGGYRDAIELARGVLSLLGSVERTGPLGSAHATAAMMGYIEAAHAVARDEAVALATACGVKAETLNRVLAEAAPQFGLNVVELQQRAELARRIARDRGLSADIIDLAVERRALRRLEKR